MTTTTKAQCVVFCFFNHVHVSVYVCVCSVDICEFLFLSFYYLGIKVLDLLFCYRHYNFRVIHLSNERIVDNLDDICLALFD